MAKRIENLPVAPFLLIAAGILLIVSTLVWVLLVPGNQVTSASSNPNTPNPSIQRVSLNEARRALDEQQATFVDVRSAEDYKISHIRGALNIPLTEISSRSNELDRQRWIITYCT